jgi:hypothetical protein
MKATLAIAVALVLFAGTITWRALGAMCSEEINTRIGRLPNALIHVAALRLPRDARSDLTDEWTAELDFIVSGTDGLPVTRLVRGLRFAASLLRVAPSVAHELTCACPPRSRLWSITRTTWLVLLSGGVGLQARIAFDSLVRSHHTAAGISAVFLAFGYLISRKLPSLSFGELSWAASKRRLSVSVQAPIELHGGFRFALGYALVGVGQLLQGGGEWNSIVFFTATAALISSRWALKILSTELARRPSLAP